MYRAILGHAECSSCTECCSSCCWLGPGADGDTSPCAQTAVLAPLGSRRASNGADGGALGAPGSGRVISPAPRVLYLHSLATAALQAAPMAAPRAPLAGGDASPSAHNVIHEVLGRHRAAGGTDGGALRALGAAAAGFLGGGGGVGSDQQTPPPSLGSCKKRRDAPAGASRSCKQQC